MRLALPVLLTGVVLVGAAACSDDGPTTSEAGKQLVTQMSSLREHLTEGVQPMQPWTVEKAADEDVASGCDEDSARRVYGAVVDVPDTQEPDAASHANQLVGQLIDAGWSAKPAQQNQTEGRLTATRSEPGKAGSTLALTFTAVDGGWHYVVSARTACLSTSG